jgi:subtilisin family serine protease
MMKRMNRTSVIVIALAALAVSLPLAGDTRAQRRDPNNPYLYSTGSWGQKYRDQWAHWKIGLTPTGEGRSAWDIESGAKDPVVVAFVDTGLDYFHPQIAHDNVWVNPKPGTGPRKSMTDFSGDLIGWNFVEHDNNPWDNDGHGTFTAGIVAATIDDGIGMAGVNRGVKIMPLRALDFMGRGNNSHIVPAIIYAVDHGAKIINLSIEQEHIARSEAQQWAVDYAYNKGVLVVVAAGNQGRDTSKTSPSGLRHVITVAGTDVNDKRLGFSNWGPEVRISAPAEEILSLRARQTDLLVMAGGKDYKRGRAILNEKWYHATGTSFAAPFVTGVASLILAKHPGLKPDQVEHMLLMSADDVEGPGWDQLTGYGRLNARKALEADPNYFLYCEAHKVQPGKNDQGEDAVNVTGTVAGSGLDRYEIQLGKKGDDASSFKTVATKRGTSVEYGTLGSFPISEISSTGEWIVRIVAYDNAGKTRESQSSMKVD